MTFVDVILSRSEGSRTSAALCECGPTLRAPGTDALLLTRCGSFAATQDDMLSVGRYVMRWKVVGGKE
jgi:hypothetical protein